MVSPIKLNDTELVPCTLTENWSFSILLSLHLIYDAVCEVSVVSEQFLHGDFEQIFRAQLWCMLVDYSHWKFWLQIHRLGTALYFRVEWKVVMIGVISVLGITPVDARGGQLEIAGVVVGSWGANTTAQQRHYGGRNQHGSPPPCIMSVGPHRWDQDRTGEIKTILVRTRPYRWD